MLGALDDAPGDASAHLQQPWRLDRCNPFIHPNRNDIVRELAAGLPSGTVHYNTAVSTVSISPEGEHGLHCLACWPTIREPMGLLVQQVFALSAIYLSYLMATGATLTLKDGQTMTCKVLICADGAYSKVWSCISRHCSSFKCAQCLVAVTSILCGCTMHR